MQSSSFTCMTKTKNVGASLSILLFTFLFGFQSVEPSLACSSGSGSLEHGSSISNGSVTVCVGTNESSPGSTKQRTTTTKTVETTKPKQSSTKKSPAKKQPAKKAPAKSAKPAKQETPKKQVESCPTKSQLASMPKSADAAERWVKATCNPAPKPVTNQKPKSKPKTKKETKTTVVTSITEVVSTPSSSTRSRGQVTFTPQPLRAGYFPQRVLRVNESAVFSSFPALHFKNQLVIGKMAEVSFEPIAVSWFFSDRKSLSGVQVERSFSSAGSYQAIAKVSYGVSYRVLGASNWQSVPGSITLASPELQITVGQGSLPAEDDGQAVLLVGEPCALGQRVFGCQD